MNETRIGEDVRFPLPPANTLGLTALQEVMSEPQEGPTENAQTLLSRLTGFKQLDVGDLTQGEVENYFETIVFPALLNSRQLKNSQKIRKVSRADIEHSMEKRLGEIRLFVQGLSYAEIAERIGNAFYTVRTNIGTTMLLTRYAEDTYSPDYFQSALGQIKPGFVCQEYVEIKQAKRKGRPSKSSTNSAYRGSAAEEIEGSTRRSVDRPVGAIALQGGQNPEDAIPAKPSAAERAKVSTRPPLGNKQSSARQKSGRKTVNPNPTIGQVETSVIREPWWLNSQAVAEVEWEQALENYTSTLPKPVQDSLHALLHNKTGAAVQAAKALMIDLLSAYVPERTTGVRHEDDLTPLELETASQLAGQGLQANQIALSSEQIAVRLFHKYERQRTTFEETIASAIIKLIRRETATLNPQN